MTNQEERHVFISYVRENLDQVDRLCEDLQSHGVNVWLDRNSIKPGARWKDAVRKAIKEGAFFIACFSEEYTSKGKTHMNEELTLGIEELRKYPTDRVWFIPVLLSECDVLARSIGAGQTLLDINWVPLYENWDAGIKIILSVIKPIPPEIQNLISALHSKNRNVRLETAAALGKIGPEAKAAVTALVVTLKDKDRDIREYSARALERIGPEAKAAVPALIEALKEKSISVRVSAAQALVNIGLKAIPALIEALKDQNRDVRMLAAKTLPQIRPKPKAAVPALIEALKDEYLYVCLEAATALANIGPEAKAAVPALIEALKDKGLLSSNAAWALAKIGQEAVPDLIKVFNDKDNGVRWAAAGILGDIGPKAKAAVPALIEALKNRDENNRMLAMKALGKIGPESKEAVPKLIKSLKVRNWLVRQEAAEALEKINTPEALKALEKYKKKSE